MVFSCSSASEWEQFGEVEASQPVDTDESRGRAMGRLVGGFLILLEAGCGL